MSPINRNILIHLTGLFIITRLTLLIFVYYFFPLIPLNTPAIEQNYVSTVSSSKLGNILIPWDGQWFLRIAKDWYPSNTTRAQDLAVFVDFPLYPILIRAIVPVFLGSAILSGFLINLLAANIGLIYLYKLARLDLDTQASRASAWYFLINPCAIFFLALYSESLYFCLSIICFYLARRHRWWLSNLCGGFAVLTRSLGIALLIPLGIEYLLHLKTDSKIPLTQKLFNSLAFVIIPLMYAAFAWYSSFWSGVNNTFFHAQTYFGRSAPSFANAISWFNRTVNHFFTMPPHGIFQSQLDIIAIIVFIGLLLISIRKLRLSYIFYSLSLVFITISSGTSTAILRYLSIAFPAYLSLAIITNKRPVLYQVFTFGSLCLMALFALLYTHWYWVA